MPYQRRYSLQEVVEILAASEGRPRPDITDGSGEPGHAIGRHTNERTNMLVRRNRHGEVADVKADSTFLVDRNSLAEIVHEALNGVPGQRELARLDGGAKSVDIRSLILRQGNDFDIFVVYRPKEVGEQMSVDWLSASQGDGCLVEVFVMVYRIPGSATQGIHIQTAFPSDFARTQGETIVRATPRPGSRNYSKPA